MPGLIAALIVAGVLGFGFLATAGEMRAERGRGAAIAVLIIGVIVVIGFLL